MDAVVALRNFIDAFDEGHIDTVKPLIPQLLDSVFNLMQQVSPPGRDPQVYRSPTPQLPSSYT